MGKSRVFSGDDLARRVFQIAIVGIAIEIAVCAFVLLT